MKKTLIIMAIAIALLTSAAFAQASTETVTANIAVRSGSLVLQNLSTPSISFPDIYLGSWGSPAYNTMNPLTGFTVEVSDTRGTTPAGNGYAWNLTMQASDFDTTNFASYQSLSVTGLTSGSNIVEVTTPTYPAAFTVPGGTSAINTAVGGPQLVKVISQTATDTGGGVWRFVVNPANLELVNDATMPTAGAYSSDITLTLTAGP